MPEPKFVHVPPTLYICFGYRLHVGICHIVLRGHCAQVFDEMAKEVAELEVLDGLLYDDPAFESPLQLDAAVRETFVSYDRMAVQKQWAKYHSDAEHAAGRKCRQRKCHQCQ
ncbi:hypothetical protein HQ524_00130 [Candidatus Uhrbacteria bacterium]|nr:hypothetical protein [Candidatus Uhrbacteria bacterium]